MLMLKVKFCGLLFNIIFEVEQSNTNTPHNENICNLCRKTFKVLNTHIKVEQLLAHTSPGVQVDFRKLCKM
jgi:hypothetical protein